MNTRTGQVKADAEMTPEELASKDWLHLDLAPEEVEALKRMMPGERIQYATEIRARRAAQGLDVKTGLKRREIKRRAWEERVAQKRRALLGGGS